METDFNKLRKWRRMSKVLAIIVIALSTIRLMEIMTSVHYVENNMLLILANLLLAVTQLCSWRYSRCPYCGKSVMSHWTGHDGAKRNCVKLIEKSMPIICVNCGERVETD